MQSLRRGGTQAFEKGLPDVWEGGPSVASSKETKDRRRCPGGKFSSIGQAAFDGASGSAGPDGHQWSENVREVML